jgi:hypothetical protein
MSTQAASGAGPNIAAFRRRLAEACRLRNLSHDRVCASTGGGGPQGDLLVYAGLNELDIHRLVQIADRLNVSIDWLFGRSEVMDLPKAAPGAPAPGLPSNPPLSADDQLHQ